MLCSGGIAKMQKKRKGNEGNRGTACPAPHPPPRAEPFADGPGPGMQKQKGCKCWLRISGSCHLCKRRPHARSRGEDPEALTPRAALLLPVILGRTTPRRNAPGGVTLGRIAPGCVELIPRGRARHQMSSGASLPPAGMRALAPAVLGARATMVVLSLPNFCMHARSLSSRFDTLF